MTSHLLFNKPQKTFLMLYVWREQNGQHREQKNILKGTRDCASHIKDTSYIHNMKNEISL